MITDVVQKIDRLRDNGQHMHFKDGFSLTNRLGGGLPGLLVTYRELIEVRLGPDRSAKENPPQARGIPLAWRRYTGKPASF